MKRDNTKRPRGTKNTIVSKILRFLWTSGPSTIDSFSESGWEYRGRRKLLCDTAFQMERAGVLEEISRERAGKRVIKNFKLTKKGMMRAAKLCMEKEKLKKLINDRRLIIFDIPEKQRFYRDYFRQLMKDLGCRMIQLSVWQADFEISQDFLLLVGELGLKRRVIIYKVKPEEVVYL